MQIFPNSLLIDLIVSLFEFSEKATSEKNTTEQWDVIMNICDNVGNSSKHAKDCIRSIIKRLNNPDPHVVIQAITVIS